MTNDNNEDDDDGIDEVLYSISHLLAISTISIQYIYIIYIYRRSS